MVALITASLALVPVYALSSSPRTRGAALALMMATAVVLIAGSWVRSEGTTKVLRTELLHWQDNFFPQMESLFYIHSQIQFRQILPPMGGWAVSPDFAASLVALVLEKRPQLVLEASCGVSTILIGYCLQKQNDGSRVISLEHDQAYAQQCSAEILRHGLQDVAEVIYAPLKNYSLRGTECLWYDDKRLQVLTNAVDILVVDGPPAALQRLWCQEYPQLTSRYLPHSKGTQLLCKIRPEN